MQRVRTFIVSSLALGSLALPFNAQAEDTWEALAPGVQILHRVTFDPWTIWAATVDLCAAGVRVRATAPDEAGLTVREFGELAGADLAVNGDYFDGAYNTTGLAVGDGMVWPDTADGPSWAFVAFGEYTSLVSPSDFEAATAQSWMSEVVGGLPSVVQEGAAITTYERSFCNVRHPRTSVGLSEDGRSLILAVVDGRSSASIGMTCEELGELMAGLGAFSAINLDGGGSSTFWTLSDGVLNEPSDGALRTVANHLAIRLDGRGGVNACPDGEPVLLADAGVPVDAGPDSDRDASVPVLDTGGLYDAAALHDAGPPEQSALCERPADSGGCHLVNPSGKRSFSVVTMGGLLVGLAALLRVRARSGATAR